MAGPQDFLHPRQFAVTSPGCAGFNCPSCCFCWEEERGAHPTCHEGAPDREKKGKFPEPWAAGLLPGGLQGSAVYTHRLLIHIVGLKIEVLAAAQVCTEDWNKRNAPATSLPQ